MVYFKMSNGVEIPCIGLGTWQTTADIAKASVLSALSTGYRLIDTAALYDNEEGVGEAIRESGIKRENIFVTSKLSTVDHGYEATLNAFDVTMEKLGLEYLDLYLIHWPNPIRFRSNWEEANAGSWAAFEELYNKGKIRSIGVSNFLTHHMDALMKTAKIKPMVNQIKLCPGVTQPEIVEYCRKNNILLEAYSPLGTGGVFDLKEMQTLAVKYGKSISQLCLRWAFQNNFISLPKSQNPTRIKENKDIFDFELSNEDMELISNLKSFKTEIPAPDEITF